MDADEYIDEDEEADETSLDGEEDLNTDSETLEETEKVSEQSLCDSEVVEGKEDYSDGWLYEEDTIVNEGDFCLPSSVANQQNDGTIGPSGPHVKTSAITGVGLQELLELIDTKLSSQDEKLKGAKVDERNLFDRKWRPSRDSSIAVEN